MAERYRPPHWRDEAACLGKQAEGVQFWSTEPGLWIQTALAYCDVCPVRVPCREEAGPSHVGMIFVRGGELV